MIFKANNCGYEKVDETVKIQKSQIVVFALWLIGIISMIIIRFNVDALGVLLLGRELRDSQKWISLVNVAGIIWTFVSLIAFILIKHFNFNICIAKITRKMKSDRLFSVFIFATLGILIYGIIIDLIKLVFHSDFFHLSAIISSLYANICLYLFVLLIIRKCKVSFSRIGIFITTCFIALAVGVFLYSVFTRHYLYFWDYSTYYKNTIQNIKNFDREFFSGWVLVWGSSYQDYSNLIGLMAIFFYSLTSGTNNAFCGSLAFSVLIPFIISVSVVALKIIDKLGLKGGKRYIALSISLFCVCCQPQLYFSLYHSMPDLFGLVFALLLASSLIGYSLEEKDSERWLIMFVSTVFMIFARRWYVFYVISIWGVYVLIVLLRAMKIHDVKTIKILFKFAGLSIFFAALFLSPMVIRVLGKNYVTDYSSWKWDTTTQNITTYIKHCGALMFVICVAGYIMYFIRKGFDLFILSSFVSVLLPLFLFHIIQTADYHQLLILAPSMIVGTVLFAACVCAIINKIIMWFFVFLITVASAGNLYNAFSNHQIFRPLLTDTSLLLPYREDYEMIDVINDWIADHSNKYGDVYMIPHNVMYCPDIFRNKNLPSYEITDLLPYGADVVSAHDFPLEVLTARYVLTSNPLGQEGTSMAPRINQVFLQLVNEGYFSLEKEFDMHNGYKIEAYKRVKEFDDNELASYRTAFEDLIELFPYHYNALYIE